MPAERAVVSLDEVEIPIAAADDERLLAVDEALDQFAAIEPRKAELVKLRYFTGMSFEEAASVLGIAVPTAKEWWAYGRAWLAVALRPSHEVGGPSAPRRFRRGRVAKRMFEIPPYFFPLEYACTDEGTSAFAYETGRQERRSPLP